MPRPVTTFGRSESIRQQGLTKHVFRPRIVWSRCSFPNRMLFVYHDASIEIV